MKALVLLSGGLDSRLAVKLMIEQGIEVEALHFTTIFCNCTSSSKGCHSEITELSKILKVPIKVINNTIDFVEVVKKPKYGYGSNINPCIDCRINMFRSARKYMDEFGASFIVTGEVLGQRPMSQHKRAMQLIEKESGLEGLILRPLSAKLMEPTIPEKKGWVNREKLMEIKGRSRKPQMAIAEVFQMKDYPCPAGGCLLTDPGFSARVKDLLAHNLAPSINDFLLLKSGRHFRLDNDTKAIVGRDEQDNKVIGLRKQPGDILMEVKGYVGPVTILRGNNPARQDENIRLAGAITARYADIPGKDDNPDVEIIIREIMVRLFECNELYSGGLKNELPPSILGCKAPLSLTADGQPTIPGSIISAKGGSASGMTLRSNCQSIEGKGKESTIKVVPLPLAQVKQYILMAE